MWTVFVHMVAFLQLGPAHSSGSASSGVGP
jgi:hypothetical protein